MKTFLVLSYCIISISVLYAQNPEWINYTTSNSGLPDNYILSIAIDGSGNKWIGTYSGGLAKFDGTTWTVYTTSNSGLPSNEILSIAIDGSGNKWIGTYGGLAEYDGTIIWTYSYLRNTHVSSIAIDGSWNRWIGTNGSGLFKFDGTNWTSYASSNSGLPYNEILSIAIDGSGNKWIGTDLRGLAKFDGATTWTVYGSSNSGLPNNWVYSITIDGSGNKWIGTSGGLAKFDGTTWTVYTTSNSGLPDNYVHSIAIDGSGNKWIGTGGGLAKFDGTTWTVYTTSNSGLPYNGILSIAIDGSGNKWIGTGGGLALYKEGGAVSVKETPSKNIPEAFVLFQNYPNPFNPSTNITFNLPSKSFVSLKVFDLLGREVATLVNQEKPAGTYNITFDAGKLPSGVYFYRLQAGSFIETKKLILLR